MAKGGEGQQTDGRKVTGSTGRTIKDVWNQTSMGSAKSAVAKNTKNKGMMDFQSAGF